MAAALTSIPAGGVTCEVRGIVYLDRERQEQGFNYEVKPRYCVIEARLDGERIVMEQNVRGGYIVVVEIPDEVGTAWTTFRYSWGSHFAWFDHHRVMMPVVYGLRAPG